MVTPAGRREAVTYLQATYAMSERHACAVIGTDRSSARYRSSRLDEGVLRARLKRWPRSGGGSAIDACMSCSGAKVTRAKWRLSSFGLGLTARKATSELVQQLPLLCYERLCEPGLEER